MPDTFTPEQISQILEEFFKVVGTRQYIGARYVPLFGRKGEESIEWDNTAPYEPLTIVLYQGNSYTSRQYVPVGVEITNQEFWAISGNYNAQVEMYRREVFSFDERITTNTNNIAAETLARTEADTALGQRITDEATARDNADTQLSGRITNAQTTADNAQTTADNAYRKNRYMVAIGDSFGDPHAGGITPLPVKWPVLVSQGLGLNLVNACKSGCGFTYSEGTPLSGQPDNKFINQVNYAANKVDPDLVDCVFIYGGVNDYTRRDSLGDTLSAQTQALTSAIIECVRNAHNKFPHSNVYLCYSDVGFAHQARFNAFYDFWGTVNYIIQQISVNERSTAYINDAVTWLLPWGENAFQSDQLHPSEMGQHIIANHIISVISGKNMVNGVPRHASEITLTGDNSSSMVVRMNQVFNGFTCTASMVTVSGSLTFNDKGNHDIYTAMQFFHFGDTTDASLVIATGTNWVLYWLPYSAKLRMNTSAPNVTVDWFSAVDTALLS